jgi:acyl carrier protein
MIITLEPNQSIEIRFAHGRDKHGDPLLSDGAITVRYDDDEKSIVVYANEPDSSGRGGIVYQENFAGGQNEDLDATIAPAYDREVDPVPTDEHLLKDAIRIVADHIGIEREIVKRESLLYDLGADSLDLIEIVMAFEWEYGIEIPDEDADSIETVGDIVAYLRKKL